MIPSVTACKINKPRDGIEAITTFLTLIGTVTVIARLVFQKQASKKAKEQSGQETMTVLGQ